MNRRLPKITKTVMATNNKYLILTALESELMTLGISIKTISIPLDGILIVNPGGDYIKNTFKHEEPLSIYNLKTIQILQKQ
jgi:hypothetical protein